MDCPWWLGLTVIPVKRSASLLSMYHASDDCTIEIEGPWAKGCRRSSVQQTKHRGGRVFEGLREPLPKPSSEVSCVF